MPLFQINESNLVLIKPHEFKLEKDIQQLIETNLDVFDCRLVASEFSTGSQHGGRIDTLALTEDGNPAIIEYKKVESSKLINQSLFYLSWLNDHRGDFQVASQNALGNSTDIDWSNIRVICIAPSYTKYDLHAVQMMGANIELWRYRLFENSMLLLDNVFKPINISSNKIQSHSTTLRSNAKDILPSYSVDAHFTNAPKQVREMAQQIREFSLSLSEAVEESPKKLYIAYKIAKNFCCMILQQKRIVLHLRLDPAEFDPLPDGAKDMRHVGHYGTGDLQYTVKDADSLSVAKELIQQAFNAVGGS